MTNNIRINRSDEIKDLFHVPIGVFEIAAIGYRKMKVPANTGGIPYIVQKKSH